MLEDVIKKIEEENAVLLENLNKSSAVGKRRARKSTLILQKLFKEYRQLSVK